MIHFGLAVYEDNKSTVIHCFHKSDILDRNRLISKTLKDFR